MTAQISRRTVLLGAGAATATAAVGALAGNASAATPETADIVIVGSGYAGAVAALRLAQAGYSSLVLERGRRWTVRADGNTFATGAAPDGRAVWLAGSSPVLGGKIPTYTGVLEAVPQAGVTCLAGAGVGGGSLVNNAVMMAPRADHFATSFGSALDHAEMTAEWYPRARALIGPSPIPADVLAGPQYANARQAQEEMRAAGLTVAQPDIAVDWDVVRAEIAGTATPSLIAGQSLFGVNSGAKKSVDRTILAAAEATGRVTLRPLSRVSTVTGLSGGGYELAVESLDEQGTVTARGTIRSRLLVLAAGSLGTTTLLLRAKSQGTLNGLPGDLGKGWGTGGDHVVLFAGQPNPNPAVGGPAHVVGESWDGSAPPVTLLNFPVGVPVVDKVTRESLAVSIVPPIGRITYSGLLKRGLATWPLADSRVLAVDRRVREIAAAIAAATPGRTARLQSGLLTSHSLGGAVLGMVTDGAGQVTGQPGLFVVDSALIPGSTGGVPPALTVTALADRCISGALESGTVRSLLGAPVGG